MQFRRVSKSKADYSKCAVVLLVESDCGVRAKLRVPDSSVWGPEDSVEKTLELAFEAVGSTSYAKEVIHVIDDERIWNCDHGELIDDPDRLVHLIKK